MTESIETAAAPAKRAGSLNSMLVADLKAMAGALGIADAARMKKPQLVTAIKAYQNEHAAAKQQSPARQPDERNSEAQSTGAPDSRPPDRGEDQNHQRQQGEGKTKQAGQKNQSQNKQEQHKQGQKKQDQNRQGQSKKADQGKGQGQNQKADQGKGQTQGDDEAEDGTRRNRRRRGRERNRPGGLRNEPDTQILEDDVLVPAAGILDVLDNYAFVRTSGYLPGADDVYLSLSMVRKFALRRGDAVVGQVRQPREGERREKFNPMVRIDSVNGAEPDAARDRVNFEELTPLHPSERLLVETGPDDLIGRSMDLLTPLGKGQRGLIVAPARAGRTQVLQSVAESITTNSPGCHLMVVLLDERPEEVTEYQRTVKGEVISSTFDLPAADTTAIAELAIDRARRLVELGHDVVVLVDGITRLGRAYNMTAPANGRTLSAGVDANALHPPKKFFGSARTLEEGGSLTILATVMVDSGSPVDELIFEEVRDTANMELWLSRPAAQAGVFPAVDVARSGTRHEEHLVSREELACARALRRRWSEKDTVAQTESLLTLLRETRSNGELLGQGAR